MAVIPVVNYSNILSAWVLSTGIMTEWPECLKVFQDKLSLDYPSVVALPIFSCQIVGGAYVDALPFTAAWSMLRYAADLMDAVQDGDNLPASVDDPSSAIDYANGLIFAAFNSISTISDSDIVQQLVDLCSELAFQASLGQALSQQYKRKEGVTLEAYWQATILKAGSVFSAGLGGGAIVGRATPDYYSAIREFGNALGVIRQIIDDCRDVFENSKTNTYEVTLPLLMLAEKMGKPISQIAKHFDDKDSLLDVLVTNLVPDMVTSVLLEWHRRALANLMFLNETSETQALETILQDFITKPWLSTGNE